MRLTVRTARIRGRWGMKVKTVIINICEACLDGVPEECHTPGCALYLHTINLPINPELYEILEDDVYATRTQMDVKEQ